MKTYGIIGAGGFGREVMPLVDKIKSRERGVPSNFVFVIEDEHTTQTTDINGRSVVKLSDFLELPGEKLYSIAIGDSRARQRIHNSIPPEQARPFSITADTAVILDNNDIDIGAIFCNFTHVTSNAKIGKHFHCNIYSYIAHDVTIGDYVTFAPGVKCNGHVVIEDHAYIGTGAIIRDGTKSPIIIGEGAVIGMGAVVTKSVAPGATVVGNPAKVITSR